jgi:hypothetical protein
MTVGVRGALKAGDVEDNDILSLDDVRYTVAILGHLKQRKRGNRLESLSLSPSLPSSLPPPLLSLTHRSKSSAN